MAIPFNAWLSEEIITEAKAKKAKENIKKNGTIARWLSKKLLKELEKE